MSVSLSINAKTETGNLDIVRHSILKADVRGSTTMIDELRRKRLNAASFFSQRFFKPINEILAAYGARKVFIEGDAVILSFPEYRQKPQQWHCIAHACGLARALLRIVRTNNAHSRQLPPLELGIGICYADETPHYLYDQERPIMISSAIGYADRLASCSWPLRRLLNPSPFNVEVLEIGLDRRQWNIWSDKDRQYLRYNVNGILLEDKAFMKLKDEIALRPVTLPINGRTMRFHHGKYPDMNGRVQEVLIREGRTGLWQNNEIQPGNDDKVFYEVVTSRHVTTSVQCQRQKEY